MKSQKKHKDIAEDDLMLSTSQNAWRKGQTQYRGRTREKAANIVIQNLAPDKPMLQTMPFNFPNDPLITLGMDWQDRSAPQKVKLTREHWKKKGTLV